MRKRLAAAVATLTASCLLWAVPAPAAVAKNPPPPKQFTATSIDAHLGYMPQSTCSPSAKPGTTALLKALIATWDGSSSGISRGCSVGGVSEHKEGRALDWRRDVKYASHRKKVDQALKWLTANNGEVAYRLGVMYIIWNQHIWSIYYPELGWRKMANRGSYTANHKNHVHISLSWDGAMAQTSWWTGTPVSEPLNSKCGAKGVRACLPKIARNPRLSWPFVQTEVPASFMPAPWTRPNIGGGPQVGRTLTAVPGTWVPEGAAPTYQWTADGKWITGATGKTFLVTADLVGKVIRVRVTAAGAGTKTSDGMTEVVKGNFTTVPKPALAGPAVVEQELGVAGGTWVPEPDSVTYTWLRNGSAIKGASGPNLTTYLLSAADAGQKISVKVTARRAGFNTRSVTSGAAKVAKGEFTTPLPQPSLDVEPVAGVAVTAIPGTWSPEPSRLAFQWYADGASIKGATEVTFTPPAKLVGKKLQVRVAAVRPGYTTTYVKSAPVVVAAA